MATFRGDLENLINRHSMESGSQTPDFVLAEYLTDALAAFDKAVRARQTWYQPEPDGEPLTVEDTIADT